MRHLDDVELDCSWRLALGFMLDGRSGETAKSILRDAGFSRDHIVAGLLIATARLEYLRAERQNNLQQMRMSA